MRLLRYGPSGREKPGMADADGNIRDPVSYTHLTLPTIYSV